MGPKCTQAPGPEGPAPSPGLKMPHVGGSRKPTPASPSCKGAGPLRPPLPHEGLPLAAQAWLCQASSRRPHGSPEQWGGTLQPGPADRVGSGLIPGRSEWGGCWPGATEVAWFPSARNSLPTGVAAGAQSPGREADLGQAELLTASTWLCRHVSIVSAAWNGLTREACVVG